MRRAIAPFIAGSVVLALLAIWAWPETPRQQRFERTAITLALGGFSLFVWFLVQPRVSRRWKTAAIFLALFLPAAAALLFEIRGVTGDLIPIIEPRWKPRQAPVGAPVSERTPGAPVDSRTTFGDFPQFYGPNRNGVLDGPRLETNWARHPPVVVWKQSVGAAWSGFAVKDGLAVTQEQRGEEECVICYQLRDGATVWSHSDLSRYSTTIAGEGPRATPAIAGDRVFTLGGAGILNCFELRTGKLLWRKNVLTEHRAPLPEWGMAGSPLALDEKVIVNVGGPNGRSLVAYAAKDGTFLWGAGDAGADYSSPVSATLLGERQILIFNAFGVCAHSLKGGPLWRHPWPGKHPHVSLPVILGTNRVLISSGYGTGSELIQLERDAAGNWTTARLWKSLALKSKFGPIFVQDDFIYGLDDGILACVDLKTGQRRWKDGRIGHGQGLRVADWLLFTSEKGELILIAPDPDGLVELSRFKVFEDKTWNPPALAGEYLLMRNHRSAACLKLPVVEPVEKKRVLSFAK